MSLIHKGNQDSLPSQSNLIIYRFVHRDIRCQSSLPLSLIHICAALARAIALDPDLIMFDEPFTGQDPISMGVIVSLIKRLNEALNLTSIVVSHDVNEILSIADYEKPR